MAMHRLLRRRQTKGAATDRSALRRWQPALYSTLFLKFAIEGLWAGNQPEREPESGRDVHTGRIEGADQ
jgi:hypothetical protein